MDMDIRDLTRLCQFLYDHFFGDDVVWVYYTPVQI